MNGRIPTVISISSRTTSQCHPKSMLATRQWGNILPAGWEYSDIGIVPLPAVSRINATITAKRLLASRMIYEILLTENDIIAHRAPQLQHLPIVRPIPIRWNHDWFALWAACKIFMVTWMCNLRKKIWWVNSHYRSDKLQSNFRQTVTPLQPITWRGPRV